MFPLTIIDTCSKDELRLLTQFLSRQPQYYPNFDTWITKKCIPNIKKGLYKTIIIISSQGEVIGDAIYTEIAPGKIKIKNFRIDPLYRRRDLGHFLFSQVQHEANNPEITLDVTSDNFPAVEFFIRNGFHIVRKERLYLPTQDEFIMTRHSL